MQTSPTPTADRTAIYVALIGLAGILLSGLTGLITYLLSRPKQKAETLMGEAQSESIRVGSIVTILGQLQTMQVNREASDEAHRKIVRELEVELTRARDDEEEQRDAGAAKWEEIGVCYLYLTLLEDRLGLSPEERYRKKTREEIIARRSQDQ